MRIAVAWIAVSLALLGGGRVAAESRQPDFSVLATTPGTAADRPDRHDGAADAAGRKRRLHLEGLGIGYDVNDRLTVKGGFRAGGLNDDAPSSPGPSGGFFLGIRRSLGGR